MKSSTKVCTRPLERLLCCPVALWTIILWDMLSSFRLGLMISVAPLMLTLALIIEPLNFLALLFGLAVANLCLSALSVLLSAYPATDMGAKSVMLSSPVEFPLVFISGLFILIDRLPRWGRVIAPLSPLSYLQTSRGNCS
jgi:ABC-2 type transport system permease protein